MFRLIKRVLRKMRPVANNELEILKSRGLKIGKHVDIFSDTHLIRCIRG